MHILSYTHTCCGFRVSASHHLKIPIFLLTKVCRRNRVRLELFPMLSERLGSGVQASLMQALDSVCAIERQHTRLANRLLLEALATGVKAASVKVAQGQATVPLIRLCRWVGI